MEILNSILFVSINAFLMQFLLKRDYKHLGFAFVPAVAFMVLNLVFGALPVRIIPIVLMYSLGILILNFMSSRLAVIKNSTTVEEASRERLLKIKYYVLHFALPIGITIFQILLLFSKEMQGQFLK